MSEAHKLVRELQLPEQRADLSITGTFHPNQVPCLPEIRKSLIEPGVDKQSNDTLLKRVAQATIKSYPASTTTVFTDGSLIKVGGTTKAGYGAVVRFAGQTESDELVGPCCEGSNYIAELTAIREALEYIEERVEEDATLAADVVIFTDSMSTLQAIESLSVWPTNLEKAMACVERLLVRNGMRVLFQWVPSHVGLVGNERADQLAKFGTRLLSPDYEEPLSYEGVSTIVREWERTRWYEDWDNSDKGRVFWERVKRPNRNDAWWQLRREASSIIAQARVGHCPVRAYLGRFRAGYDTRCRHCREDDETIEHILQDCRVLHAREREKGLDARGTDLTLYGDRVALDFTACFLARALRE